ncbi:MAG: hypothetical protein ACM31N_09705 [Deltaproteobacteria bacterium]
MKPRRETKSGMTVPIVAAAAVVTIVAVSSPAGRGGPLLLALLFWTAVVEGCIAAAAAGTLVNARGLGSVESALTSVRPLLLLLAFLLLLLIPFVDSYPWARNPGIWLRKDFFLGRNVAFMLIAYAAAGWYASAPAGNEGAKNVRAAAYLFVFVVSQTLAAFDLVMSIEYPWYSALFGGYFFIESIYAGFAVAAILCILAYGKPPRAEDPETPSFLSDISVLMFGFSLMWAGLFFAQYLTIWYGNIPEEVSFIAKRALTSPYRELGALVLVLLFFIPFPALLPTRAKSNPIVVTAVALSILSGILIERYVFLAPAVHVNPGVLAIDLICLLLPFAIAARRGARWRT